MLSSLTWLRIGVWTIVLGPVTALLAYLPWMLLVHAETTGGRAFGIGALLLLGSVLALAFSRSARSRRFLRVLAGTLAAGSVVCIAVSYSVSPSGAVPSGNFSQHFSRQSAFRKLALPNLVPEIDQLKLGSFVIRHLDPLIDRGESCRIRDLFLGIYREMEKDQAFSRAGSALGMCYEDIFLDRRRLLHFHQYVPRHLGRTSYPVLIFLHGSMGNFRGYTWVLKELADMKGLAVIAPTYGCGNWYRDEQCSVLTAVLDHCLADPELDESAVYLAGLSNGGTGVTRAIVRQGQRYAGFILVSPVLEQRVIATPSFASNAAGRGFLIIQGEEDDRIPAGAVREREDDLRRRGLSVTSHYYPGEDHFLFFSQRSRVIKDMADWIGGQERSGSLTSPPTP
jgi:poly(3-hydroxybutyrate) depolymerase